MSGGFLDRWSRRKLASAGKALLADGPASDVPPASARESGAPGSVGPADISRAPELGASGAATAPSAVEAQLPAVEGLTLASDFTAFLKEEVSETLRRKALQKLFADPHFSRMDGLDIYIDDYSLPDPIPPEAMAKLKSAREWLMANEAEVEELEARAGVDADAPVLPADRMDPEDVPSDPTNGEARDQTGGERVDRGCADEVAVRPVARAVAGGVTAEAAAACGAGHQQGARQGGMQEGGTQERGTQASGRATDLGDSALQAATSAVADKPIESGQKAP